MEQELCGWVRSRRRGNQRLLFVDIDLESLVVSDGEEDDMATSTIVNDKFDLYYKYKTAFGPSPDNITLVIYSEDTMVQIGDHTQLSCDQFRKLLTVGSYVSCFAYEDNISFYSESKIPPWFRNTKENEPERILMKVNRISAVSSSRPVIASTKQQKNLPEQIEIPKEDIHCNGAAHKKERTKIFVNWLLETYGFDYLNSGTGVIDIAGGKGAISWELQCIRKIKCSLVDPRTVNLSGKQKKYLRKNNIEKFDHYQVALHDPESDSEAVAMLEMNSLFQNCSLIIGMHPDEATDSIVQYAVFYNKPFAIIPCCVYAELFPNRQICGQPVLTYESLLDYIQYQVAHNVHRTSLPFQGRNLVLFRHY